MGSDILEAYPRRTPRRYEKVQCLHCSSIFKVKIQGKAYRGACPQCGARFSVTPGGAVCFQQAKKTSPEKAPEKLKRKSPIATSTVKIPKTSSALPIRKTAPSKEHPSEASSSLCSASQRLLRKIHKQEQKILRTTQQLQALESDLWQRQEALERTQKRRASLTLWMALLVFLPLLIATFFLLSAVPNQGFTTREPWKSLLQREGTQIQKALLLQEKD